MGGTSRSNNAERSHLQVIQAWMNANVKNRGYDRYDELHVDRIDTEWRPRVRWIDAGLEAWRLAVEVRDRSWPSFTVALAFSLSAEGSIKPEELRNRLDVGSHLGASPPSLYLFTPGSEPWGQTPPRHSGAMADSFFVKDLPRNLLGSTARHCHYLEFRQVQYDEWSRSIMVEG